MHFDPMSRAAICRRGGVCGATASTWNQVAIRDREKPHGSPLPHHRTNGSRIRRFGRLSQGAKHTALARQPERHLQPRQRRFHPSHRACAPWTRRMQYRCSLASDLSSLSIPSRGTVRAFSDSRHLSGRRRRACALASVRRPNCTCGFPACSFHEDSIL